MVLELLHLKNDNTIETFINIKYLENLPKMKELFRSIDETCDRIDRIIYEQRMREGAEMVKKYLKREKNPKNIKKIRIKPYKTEKLFGIISYKVDGVSIEVKRRW